MIICRRLVFLGLNDVDIFYFLCDFVGTPNFFFSFLFENTNFSPFSPQNETKHFAEVFLNHLIFHTCAVMLIFNSWQLYPEIYLE